MKADNGKEINMDYSTDKLVPNFPDDIPVLPDCTIAMNQVFQNGRNAIATLITGEKTEEVIEFYEEHIPLMGWDPGERFDLDNIVMLNGKQEKANLNISITSANKKTTINIARTETMD